MVRTAPRLILICGLPGAGKTTLSRRLATEIPALRLCPDEWIVRLGFDLFDEVTRERIETLQWELAQQLLRLGQCVILENGFWVRSERDEKRLAAKALGALVELHYLALPLDELWRRIEGRNSDGGWATVQITREQLERWSASFQAPDEAELRLFDPPERGLPA